MGAILFVALIYGLVSARKRRAEKEGRRVLRALSARLV
jgi:hypothetical protein